LGAKWICTIISFFEEAKIKYIIKSKESFVEQDVSREEHQSQTLFTQRTFIKEKQEKKNS